MSETQFKNPTPTAEDVKNIMKYHFDIEQSVNIHVIKQNTSHLLPSNIINFDNDLDDNGRGYEVVVPFVTLWRKQYDQWRQVGVIDNVKRISSSDVEMLEFWYVTLCTGLLSSAASSKDAISLDGLGYAPAIFAKHDEGYDEKKQTLRNANRLSKLYSQLQTYHTLEIDKNRWDHYFDQRMRAHITPIEDCVCALMQLLCHWSDMAAITDASKMNVAWNIVFHQWVQHNATGVDEALVRFATFMIKDAKIDFEKTRRVCNCKSLSTFVQLLFESTLNHRQLTIDALTDIFQNHTMGHMKGRTEYQTYTDEEPPDILYKPQNVLAEKVPLIMNGHLWIPVLDTDGKVTFTKKY